MHAIVSHRPSRLSCIFGFGAALVLAGSALTIAPPPARAGVSGWLQVGTGEQAVAGQKFHFYVDAHRPDGLVDHCFNHQVHFSSTDGAALLPYDYTFQNPFPTCTLGDLGHQVFSMYPITAGPQTITVTDVTDPTVTSGTLTFTVAPGPATSLTVSDLPASTVVGAETPFRVTLTDESGNVATNYTGTVGFTSTDGSATLPGSYTFNSGDSGTHTFTVNFALETPQTVTVTDAANASLHASATTNVMPAGGDFSVNCNSATAGVATPCWVNAQYSNYYVNTGYIGTIHFTSSDKNAVKPADYTFQSTDQGMAPVFYPTFKTAGSQTLTVTDTTNSTITGTSAGIVVTAAAAKTLTVATVTSWTAGASHSIAVKALDAYGNTATGYRGTIHFTSTDTHAVLPANYTFTAANNGTHTFSFAAVLKTAGTQWLTAKDTLTASIMGSRSTVVTPAAATHLSVATVASWTAGSAHSVVVKALDASGNTATGYRGTIHFTSSDAHAVLPANYTFTAADNGTHTFSFAAILKTAGKQWLTAKDTLTASIMGSRSTVVTPAAATHLSVATVTSWTAGSAHSMVVKALDAYGNTATGYRGTIHFTSSDAHAVLPSNYTFTAADNGTHTFSFATILKTAGSQWIRATDTLSARITGVQSGIVVT